MRRSYLVLLVVFLLASVARAEESSPASSSPTSDAGLWLLVGGTVGAVAAGGTAVFFESQLNDPRDFTDVIEVRSFGVAATLLALTAGAIAATGGVLLLLPSE